MGYKTPSGSKSILYHSVRGVVINTAVALSPNIWVEVLTYTGGALPSGVVEGSVFKTPDTSETAITLVSGDAVYPLTLTVLCKTDATVDLEEGTADVTDDCESGHNANVLDGYADIKGTLGGFLKLDDTTGVIKDDSLIFFKKFLTYYTDDGAGSYVITAKANEKFLLFYCFNKDAIATEKQNWLIVPILISAMSAGSSLKDSQKRDLTWVKAQGPAALYARTAFAADVI